MTSRDFRGIPSIQEVECWGGNLNSEVKLISLQLFKLPESTVLASLNVITNSCLTFSEFSSCRIHSSNTHRSLLRMLVHDLEEGDSREYGCTANTVNQLGNSIYENWKLILRRNSKCKAVPANILIQFRGQCCETRVCCMFVFSASCCFDNVHIFCFYAAVRLTYLLF